jgi:hypothetical protein
MYIAMSVLEMTCVMKQASTFMGYITAYTVFYVCIEMGGRNNLQKGAACCLKEEGYPRQILGG